MHSNATHRALLEALRQRFTTSNLRSRSLRLNRCAKAGAMDLDSLRLVAPEAFAALADHLGDDAHCRLPLIQTQPAEAAERALADALSSLSHAAHDAWQETGSRELAIGWPLLEGRLEGDIWIRSPLLLYPAWLDTSGEGLMHWQLHLQGPPALNLALAATLRRFLGLSLNDALLLEADRDQRLAPDAATWHDLHGLFARLGLPLASPPTLPPLLAFARRDREQRQGAPVRSLRLEHTLILGRFPPASTSLLGDYDALLDTPLSAADLGRAADLLDADLLGALDADRRGADTATSLTALASSSGARAPGVTALSGARQHTALDSDSSQDAVLAWLDQDDATGLVVQGPPGTGKSQLITNLLTAVVARNMRALVVCEKRAALDVVAQRLTALGLGEALALVHDVSADRDPVCAALAATLDPMSAPDPASPADAVAVSDHEAALARARARLALSDQAFEVLTRPRPHHRSLCALQALALDDPGDPLPDLSAFSGHVTEDLAWALQARLDALSGEVTALASPHPLSARGDWRGHTDADLMAMRAALEQVFCALDDLAALRGGHLTPAHAARMEPLWRAVDATLALLTTPDRAADLHQALLFWLWTGGDLAHGLLQTVTSRLQRAQQELRFSPPELILEPAATLRGWIDDLGALERLRGQWWRGLRPRFWRLRALPSRVLDRCPSLYEERAALGGLPVNVRRLCEGALGWQALIADLPHDHPLLAFGLQGDPQEITDALSGLDAQQARARQIQGALNALRDALGASGASYATPPNLADLRFDAQADPFLRAAQADRQRALRFLTLTERVNDACALWGGEVPSMLRALLDAAGEGGFGAAAGAPRRARVGAWPVAARAASVDRLLASEPDWVRAFLRRWRPASAQRRAGQDALWALTRAWRAQALAGHSRRALEAPLTDDAMLDALDQDITASQHTAARATRARYRQRLGAALAKTSGQGRNLRQLAAAVGRRRKRLSLRQLIEVHWGRGLSDVRPLWLCSPDAVAALFPLRVGLFDVVIFDEASQCPVESAPTVALRGRRVLIAGDEQQLPPSQLFQATAPPAEVAAEVAQRAPLVAGSLLELAKVAYPTTALRWHYRSRHEALIAFSNAAFYGGQLITAPRAARPIAPAVEGLHWRQLDGIWEAQRNDAEAAAVVDVIKALLASRTPQGQTPSLGVVTFNLAQADLIYQTLQARAAMDEGLRQALMADRGRPAIEQLFIRNLENVQGDERDVILFSPAYAPAQAGGKVAARFGPLNLVGGEKRLNVAITRAKLGVWVVASFDPDQLDTSATRHVGPKLFQLYLRYVRAVSDGREVAAQRVLQQAAALVGAEGAGGWQRGGDDGSGSGDSDAPWVGQRVRDEVAVALTQRGLFTRAGYGVGRQRLDLVFGAEPDDWHAAIDTSAFLTQPDTLTRDLYQRRYWRRLGWRIHRVTPGAWLADRVGVLAALSGDPSGGDDAL
jgi:hypothetical protein